MLSKIFLDGNHLAPIARILYSRIISSPRPYLGTRMACALLNMSGFKADLKNESKNSFHLDKNKGLR